MSMNGDTFALDFMEQEQKTDALVHMHFSFGHLVISGGWDDGINLDK